MNLKIIAIPLLGWCLSGVSLKAQDNSADDSTGLPGDNFSLQGALAMFEKAGSPEEFEKLINTPDNHVNNLDLNGDGETDYVRVIDKSDGNNHVFILQVPVSENESQDIAVIELEKSGNEFASLQIVGDEDIYGEQKIVEPENTTSAENDNSGNGSGPYYNPDNDIVSVSATDGLIVNVWFWPCVRFVYRPAYTLWVSPWRWRHYPVWWHPWRPFAWHVFHPYVRTYHRSFVVVRTNRMVHARALYTPYRTTSVIVRTRHQGAINQYKVSRTTIYKKNGHKTKAKKAVIKRRRKG